MGPNVAEAALLVGLGTRAGLALAAQANAPVPFGVFHDLRWLVVYSDSWPALVVEALAVLVGRSLLTAFTVRAAWPADLPRPPLGALVARAGVFTLAAAVLFAPGTVLLFGLAVAPISWLFLAAVPATLIIALLFHHGAIAPGWWRETLSLSALGWLAFTFVMLSAAGLVIVSVPGVAAIAIAGLAGLFEAWAWRGLVGAVARRPRRVRLRPVAPAGLLALAIVIVAGTVAGFGLASTGASRAAAAGADPPAASTGHRASADLRSDPGPRASDPGGAPDPGGASPEPRLGQPLARQPVLVASGYGTHWNGRAPAGLPGRYLEWRFSYRGLGPNGRPEAYTSADTTKPLVDLERLMAQQVDALARLAHRPVSIVADSEGSLIAKAYLAASDHPPVRTLIMASPLVQPARVYYPPAGSAGWGLAGGAGLFGLSQTVEGVAPIPLSPRTPFLRSLVQEARVLRPLLACRLPGIHQVAFLPLADAVASPFARSLGIPSLVLPAFHGTMFGNRAADRAIRTVLAGGPLPVTSAWSLADRVIGSAASAWQVPDLTLTLNPAHEEGSLDRADPGRVLTCPAIRALLRLQLTGSGR